MIALVRYGAAPAALALSLLLAGCGERDGGPAPLVLGAADMPAPMAAPPPLPPPEAMRPRLPPQASRLPQRVKVARGESLSGLARTYHVTERALIEANHLQPPYRVRIGSMLLIPGSAATPEPAPPRLAAAALPAAVAAGPAPKIAAAPSHGAAAEVAADVAAEEHAPPSRKPSAPRIVLPAAEKPGEKTAPPPAAHAGGGFLWPVRGRVLATYGAGTDGTHNDGINIAAPKGAAVEAADAGTVAYAGNELRGYGNLVLIKHANGWISAYAHCEEILVKRGQKVGRGQTIARVGATGSVKEPQLHFELRRGDHPVDPRGLLAPPSSAAAGKPAPPG